MIRKDCKEFSLRDTLVSCFTQQLSEYELLQSMYPENDAFVLTDCKALDELNNFISGSSDYKPLHLDFILKLSIDKLKLEVFVNLPSLYPAEEEPDIYVRCNQLNRDQESSLNEKLSKYIKEHHKGEVCLYTAIIWLQDNIDSVTSFAAVEKKGTIDENKNNEDNDRFTRMWIYSHHIYNKRKREEIISLARELNLTGFCLSGKPGIVCIEGVESNCNKWWKVIKNMTWKKIVVRKTELFELNKHAQVRKFQNFKEIYLDMGGFSKYLNENGLTYAFQEIFGFNDD